MRTGGKAAPSEARQQISRTAQRRDSPQPAPLAAPEAAEAAPGGRQCVRLSGEGSFFRKRRTRLEVKSSRYRNSMAKPRPRRACTTAPRSVVGMPSRSTMNSAGAPTSGTCEQSTKHPLVLRSVIRAPPDHEHSSLTGQRSCRRRCVLAKCEDMTVSTLADATTIAHLPWG